MKRLIAFTVALIVVTAGFVPAVAYGNEAKRYEERIFEYNLQKSSAASVQEWIDGELTDDAGAGSEWYIIALSNHGDYDFSNYNAALNNYLSKNEVGSASSRLKYALTYIAIGDRDNPYIGKALGNSIGEQGIMSLVFGLHLLNNGCISDTNSVNGLIGELLSLQLADGGFSAYGVENPESTAQVVIALSSLGIDAATDKRFIKNGSTVFDGMSSFCLADGSFSHKEDGVSDPTATAQVLCAAIAYDNMKDGKSPFYVFNQNKNICAETTTNAITTEPTSTTETTVFIENASKTASTSTSPESDTQKTEPTETRENKSDSVRVVIISVFVTSILICAVLIAVKKHKFTVPVIVAAVAVVALVAGISGVNDTDTIGSVTISIRCDVIKNEDKSFIPKNGIILDETEVDIQKGDSVYDVLAEACKENKILFSANMGYIEGISNIYEMDFGKSSGWIYFVNGESPSVGCGSYEPADGDEIEWHYTCEMGKDLDIDLEK